MTSPGARWLAGLVAVVALGCGGGGAGVSGPSVVSVSGSVLWIENLQPTNPASSVAIGGNSGATDLGSGFFSVDAPPGQTKATVTYVPGGGSPVVTDFTFPTVIADTDLGDLYIGPAKVEVRGRLVSSATALPIPGGTAAFAGRTATSASDGTFNIADVAYPSASFTGFLSLSGVGGATSYFNQSFQAVGLASAGVVQVGDVALVPSGSDSPPGLPANMVVTVQPIATSQGAAVTVKQGGPTVTTGTVGADGRVQFWLPVGSYTLSATQGTLSGTQSASISTLASPTTATITLR